MTQNIENTNQNLLHIANRDHLISYLLDTKEKFVVLALVLIDTPDQTKVIIRKHIKEKSKLYPNVIFLYCSLKKDDCGKVWNLLPEDESKYPIICHVYDIEKKLGEVFKFKDRSSLSGSEFLFTKFHDYYINFNPHAKQKQEEIKQQQNQQNQHQTSTISDQDKQKQDNENVYDNENNVEDDEFYNISGNEIKKQNTQQIQEVYKPDIATERKKLIEKINFIKQAAEEFKTSFIKDIQKRKEKEIKLRGKRKEESDKNIKSNKVTEKVKRKK